MNVVARVIIAMAAVVLSFTSNAVYAQQQCAASVEPIEDSYVLYDYGLNSAPILTQAKVMFRSFEEMLQGIKEETERYLLADGWQQFTFGAITQGADQSIQPLVWQWTAIRPDGVPVSSDTNGATQVYYDPLAARCPNGYKLTVQSGALTCNLSDVNAQNCPTTPKPDKGRGACPSNGVMQGNPCNIASGNKFQRESDYASSDGGNSWLNFERFYNSDLSTPMALMGKQWRHSFDRRLVFSTAPQYVGTHDTERGAFVQRPDGQIIPFTITGTASTIAPRDPDTAVKLVATNLTTWEFTDADNTVETYRMIASSSVPDNMTFASLVSIKYRNGITLTLTYSASNRLTKVADNFGRELIFTYASNRLSTMKNPAGGITTYQYNTKGLLASVTYPDSTIRKYLYAITNRPEALTSIVDENNSTYASWSYDTSRRAITSQHAGGAERIDIAYNSNGTSTVTDALGSQKTYTFDLLYGVKKVTGTTEAGMTESTTFDVNGYVSSTTDKNGNQTLLTNDANGLNTLREEAHGTARARTTTTAWNSTLRLPTQIDEPGRRTTFTHDSSGNLLTRTVLDTALGTSRTWTFTYNVLGQVLTVNGPRTDVSDVTTYTYYTCSTGSKCGQVATVTNALGQVTQYLTYNAHGQPLTILDANSVLSTLTYDLRQRLTSRTTGSETTGFAYWPTGLLKKVTLPDSTYLNYAYDAAHRLTSISDSEGNYVVYTLDAASNRTKEEVFDASSALSVKRSSVFNSLSQLSQLLGAAGTPAVTTTFGYDANGNQTTVNAPLGRNSINAYDELNRIKQVTDPSSGITQYGYNALDQMISVTDPRNLQTTYTYNALGDLKEQVSPDTGTTINAFDSGGNLKTKEDARGKTATYNYDAANRVTQIAFGDQTIAYGYDAGANGVGRLTSTSDSTNSASWAYDSLGRVTSKTQTVGTVTKTTGYGYTNGHLTSIVTPSNHTIVYSYTHGKVSGITVNGASLLTNVLYEPFGQTNGWTWSNGTLAVRIYDTDGKLTQLDSAGLNTYGYDDAFRITGITDTTTAANSWTFGYDSLDRLSAASRTGLTQGFTYDADGNRLTQTGTVASTLTYSGISNKLSSTTGTPSRSYTYDAAGNTLGDGTIVYTYYDNGRLMTAKNGTADAVMYTYNALGQRVKKTGTTRYFAYDEGGHLLGEYDAAGTMLQEFVWLGDTPVTVLTPNGAGVNIFYIHSDHLNTPRKITRASDNMLRWTWNPDPFGNGTPNENPQGLGAFSFNLRFPGQYFDSETGSHYNYLRDYDPMIGRYTTSDPIGLDGGINTYSYVEGNPISRIDPQGLESGSFYTNPIYRMGLPPRRPDPSANFSPESREETMRRICKYAGPPWNGHVPRDESNWHDLNQRNAEHYYFGNELGGRMGPLAPVSVALYEGGKYVRYVFGRTTRPTALGFEMGLNGSADGWLYRRPTPEECQCQQ